MGIQQGRHLRHYLVCVACSCVVLSATSVNAINVNWDGEDDDDWNSGINWDYTICAGFICAWVPPGADDIAILSNTARGNRSELSADIVVKGIKIQNGFTVDTNGFQINSGSRETSSTSKIEIIGGNSRLLVEGGGGPDPDLVTNRFQIYGAGGTLQLDDALATITSSSGVSTVNPASTIRGSGAMTFNNASGSPQVVFENAGLIDVFGGDLTLRAENGGLLDLDGALGDDGILDVDDGNFFGISGSRTLRVEGPLLTAFDGAIRIGRGDAVDFEMPWQLGQNDQSGIAGSGTLRMRGGLGTATLAGAAVTVTGADTIIEVESGTARFEADMSIQDVTLTMADETTMQLAGVTNFTGGVWNIADDSTIEILGNVDIGPNVVVNSGNLVGYDLVVAGNLTVRTDPFDWDARPQAHTTTVQGGTLRILSPQIDTLGGTIDTIPDENDFGGILHVNSEPGQPALLEVSTVEPWILSREMFLHAVDDVARVEGAPLVVGYDISSQPLGMPAATINVAGANAEIASVVELSNRAVVVTDPTATLRFTNALTINEAAKLIGGGTIRSEHVAHVESGIQMQVNFVNDGTFNLNGPGSTDETGQLSLDGFEQTTDGIFNVDLGGKMLGEFDRLIVANSTTLAGVLQISLVDGFTPLVGDSFLIIDGIAPVAGTFDGLAEGAAVGNFAGVDLFITYAGGDGNDVALFSALPGDFDFDHDVDGFDFLAWQLGESPDPSSQSDLMLWEMNYGSALPLSATSTTVPEPSSWMLAALCSAMRRLRSK